MVTICGIFGISYGPQGAAGEDWTPTEFSQIMFPAIVHRGPHAFGWMSYNPETGITTEKHYGNVTKGGNLSKVALDDDAQWFVAHVRYATNGKPEHMPNNHPIIHGKVVGVHNGVLKRHSWEAIIEETGREDDSAEVDSEAIFAAVNKWGVRGGLTRIEGDMVTVFAQTSHPDVLHIARSHGRPLVYATTENGSLIFASECCVIDACGLGFGKDDYTHMNGQYRHMKVVRGAIKERSQYKTPASRPFSNPAYPAPGRIRERVAYGQGGVSGITDYFDQQEQARKALEQSKQRPKGKAIGTALDGPGERSRATQQGRKDTRGGEYIGAGWYRLPDGKIMPVHEYVEWAVQNELNRREDEDMVRLAQEQALLDETLAQQIINNNT